MSLFSRSFGSNDPTTSFHPLFRFLDDFDEYRSDSGTERKNRSHTKSFVPKFDVSEHSDRYELHGELPGIEKKDVEIEFSDRETLVIRGHTERSYTSGTPAAGSIEVSKSSGAIEGGHENGDQSQTAAKEHGSAKKDNEVGSHENKSAKPDVKYWVSERSVGHFSRSFNFPTPVDQDNVRASLNNGILSVIIPKAKKPESRKITIS
jgi:HSP20 family molecular chaperone IbpA